MAIEALPIPAYRVVYVRFSGVVTVADLTDVLTYATSLDLSYRHLSDLSRLSDMSMTFAETHGYFHGLNGVLTQMNAHLTKVIYAPNDTIFGVARMFENLSMDSRVDCRTFKTECRALDALDLPFGSIDELVNASASEQKFLALK
jgi:hypothetical protein